MKVGRTNSPAYRDFSFLRTELGAKSPDVPRKRGARKLLNYWNIEAVVRSNHFTL